MTAEINHNELKEHIRKAYKTEIALFVTGTMGIGKSDTIKQTTKDIATDKNMEFVEGWEEGKFGLIDIRLSQFNPEDLKGLPMFDTVKELTKWLLPEILPRSGKGIMFFDELNLATPSIQAAAYQLILDKKLGSYKLPDGWAIISAGNGTEDNANTYELPAPLANRFAHVKLNPPTVDDWTQWAVANNINKNIITYLNFKKSYLYKFDNNSNDVAFPTPRSWAFASRMIEGETDEKNVQRYIASAVGDAVAREYIAYHKMAAQLDIDKMIKNPKDFKNPEDINVSYAIAGGLAERYNINPKLLKNICQIFQILKPEFTVISMKLCKAYKPRTFNSDILKLPEWDKLSKEYSKYLM